MSREPLSTPNTSCTSHVTESVIFELTAIRCCIALHKHVMCGTLCSLRYWDIVVYVILAIFHRLQSIFSFEIWRRKWAHCKFLSDHATTHLPASNRKGPGSVPGRNCGGCGEKHQGRFISVSPATYHSSSFPYLLSLSSGACTVGTFEATGDSFSPHSHY
jgi:hypothetical protein